MRRWCYPAVALTLAVLSCMTAASAVAASGAKRPKIAKHADVSAEATSASGAVVHYAPARVRGATSIKYSKRSGSVFPLGTTRVTITARNRAGVSRSRFKVSVVDTTAPTIAALGDVTTLPTGANGANVTYGPVQAVDRVDQSVDVSCSPASGSVFPAGTTTVGCTARDDAGNQSSSTFHVTVLPAKPGHWSGTTAQGLTISFDVSADGRQVVNLTYDLTAPCTPNGTWEGTAKRIPAAIAPDGTFSLAGTGPVTGDITGVFNTTITGRFTNPVTATGSFEDHLTLTNPAGYQCNTGPVSWTATTA
jgi:HYR domain